MESFLDDLDFDLDEMLGVEKKEPSAESKEKDRLDPRRKQVVCKHWLRDLCKRGDDCDFLHVYDVTRMPECLCVRNSTILIALTLWAHFLLGFVEGSISTMASVQTKSAYSCTHVPMIRPYRGASQPKRFRMLFLSVWTTSHLRLPLFQLRNNILSWGHDGHRWKNARGICGASASTGPAVENGTRERQRAPIIYAASVLPVQNANSLIQSLRCLCHQQTLRATGEMLTSVGFEGAPP
eukprot:6205216-Pleurochrysis_carterae.AAC.1